MSPLLVCFAGLIGSGKSSLSTLVAEQLGWKRVSFGDFVRARATQLGRGHDRQTLQEIGAALPVELGWAGFCTTVLESGGWKPGLALIVDGIRHIEAYDAIKRIVTPSDVALIFISIDDETFQQRMTGRGVVDIETQQAVQNHSTEMQVKTSLREVADLVIDSSLPLPLLSQQVTAWLDSHRT